MLVVTLGDQKIELNAVLARGRSSARQFRESKK
jgi:hypothetical protein